MLLLKNKHEINQLYERYFIVQVCITDNDKERKKHPEL